MLFILNKFLCVVTRAVFCTVGI